MINHLDLEKPLWKTLKEAKKPIILYGTGNGADKILNFAERLGINIQGIFASDAFVRGQEFKGFKVLNYNRAKDLFGDMIVLQAFGTHRPEVLSNIRKLSAENEYYIPDIEVMGEEFFTALTYTRMYKDLCFVYDLLSDDCSKIIFDNLMLFKISGKPKYLFFSGNAAEDKKNILKLNNSEIYVDIGAYDGDTIFEFLNSIEDFSHIYAFEPDKYNFRKLYKNFNFRNKIFLYNIAVSDKNDFIKFNQLKGRQSAVNNSGIQTTACRKIDSFAPDATYIKIDAEGSEYNILKGMRRTIYKNKPKIKVAAYHKNSDLLLPLYIKNIQPDYKVYLRRGDALPPWDLNYYFV